MEEPQPNNLRQALSHGIQSIWSHFEALVARAIGWWQSLDPQNKRLLKYLGMIIVLIVVLLAIWKIPQRQLAPLKAKIQRERNSLLPQDRLKLEHDARKLENDARTALLQAVGGLALLIGLYFTAKTWRTTQEGQVTDRFTKAVNQLGETGPQKLAIRLGGIYALERIARDSARDHWPIMEILTAYIRENAPWKEETEEEPSRGKILPSERVLKSTGIPLTPDGWLLLVRKNESGPKPATDIQAALTVIGRRARTYGKAEDQPLNLSHINLQGANLSGAQLQEADFSYTQLQGANLAGAQLQGANLTGAQLQGAYLVYAQLHGADLWDALLERANLYRAVLEGAILLGTQLQRANLAHAQLQEAELTSADLQGVYFEQTQLHGAILAQAQLTGARNLTIEQLSTVETLYEAVLDAPLREQVEQRYPHLLEEPEE